MRPRQFSLSPILRVASLCVGALCVATLGAGTALAVVDGQSGGFAASVDWDRSPGTLVLSLVHVPGQLGDGDSTPLLRLYGDGKLLVHYPVGFRNAGTYELRLEADEVRELLADIATRGLLELDATALRRELVSAERARLEAVRAAGGSPTLTAVSDDDVTVLSVALSDYKPAGALGSSGVPATKELRWYGVRTDARRFPERTELQSLLAVQERLLSLANRAVPSPDRPFQIGGKP